MSSANSKGAKIVRYERPLLYGRFNRRGILGEFALYVPFLILWLLILIGIVGGVYAFYGKGYDSRADEAKLLYELVRACAEKNGFDSFFANETSFYEKCRMSQKIIEDGEHLVYLKKDGSEEEFFRGVYDFKNRCFFKGAEKNKDFPLCESGTVILNDLKYELTTGSSQGAKGIFA